ncbi:hypothetical protein NFI00_000222 [Salmonella enterica]|nr:hypothetical protein [Salmonella enterica]
MSEVTIFDKIVAWSKARNIIGAGTTIGQVGKFNEEVGEIQTGLVRVNQGDIKDAIGDALVIMTNVLAMEDYRPHMTINLNVQPTPRFKDLHDNHLICGINYKWNKYFWEEAFLGMCMTDLDDLASDVVELLAELANRHGFTLTEAINESYAMIEHRVGIFYNNVFIKQADFTVDLLERISTDKGLTNEVRAFAIEQLNLLREKL